MTSWCNLRLCSVAAIVMLLSCSARDASAQARSVDAPRQTIGPWRVQSLPGFDTTEREVSYAVSGSVQTRRGTVAVHLAIGCYDVGPKVILYIGDYVGAAAFIDRVPISLWNGERRIASFSARPNRRGDIAELKDPLAFLRSMRGLDNATLNIGRTHDDDIRISLPVAQVPDVYTELHRRCEWPARAPASM
jgi:hypothetical protein